MAYDRIDTAARRYLGVPWRRLGRTEHGLDCVGLLLCAAKDAGYNVPEIEPYENEPSDRTLINEISKHCDDVTGQEILPGDIVTFRMGLYAAHIGIVSFHPEYKIPSVIHAYAPRHCVVEEPLSNLLPVVWRVFRIKE